MRVLAAIALAAVCAAALTVPGSAGASLRSSADAAEARLEALEREGSWMRQSADRFADWQSCISLVPLREFGDPDRRFGYAYDERDGNGRGHMPALAVDRRRGRRAPRPDYMFLDFAKGGGCETAPTLPGGTAEPASARWPRLARRVKGLERRVERLKRLRRRLERSSERFDSWKSCVSLIPVTEYGDPFGKFGFLFGAKGVTPGYRAALSIDRGDWDDPDYMFLAFVGRDRPGRDCQNEPGEAVD